MHKTMITLTRDEAQQVLDTLIYTQTAGIKLANVSDAVETLRARLSAPEPDVDWKDMYEKEKRLREMLADKYEKDLRKLGRAVPTAQPEPEPVAICPNCLGTKRPHSIDPEWKGRCDCAPPQPEQEPVAYLQRQDDDDDAELYFGRLTDDEIDRGWTEIPLYTAPPQREVVFCGCGDGIVPDDGAECGTCVSMKQATWQVIPDSVGTKHLTEMKAKSIIERDGRVVTGYVLDTNDSVCIVYHSAVRWYSNEEMFRVMHSNVYQPKPVAWMDEEGFTWTGNEFPHEHKGKCKPLYTAPPQREWQGLTDEEIRHEYFSYPVIGKWGFARAIEKALREKNT